MKGNTNKGTSGSSTTSVRCVNRLTAGARGPLSFQNITLHEKMVDLNNSKSIDVNPKTIQRSMISSKIYATGSFKVSNDINRFTKAKIFNTLGKDIKILVRFSKNCNETINSDSVRDPKEFAIKFYTEEGNIDLTTKNLPVNLLSNSEKILDCARSLNSDSEGHEIDTTRFWDFVSSNPESLHYALMMLSDRGTPVGYRHMNSYGERIFTMTNAKNEKLFVKFHLKTMQGIRNFTGEEATELYTKDPNFVKHDLAQAIAEKDFPKWELKMQVMKPEQVKQFIYNPFDLTKVWPQRYFPLINIGEIELNEIPENNNDFDKSAFNSTFEMEGIDYSLDDHDLNYESDEDYYSHPQLLFNNAMNDYNRENLILNIVNSMQNIEGKERENIIARQISHFFRVDVALGASVAKGLDVNLITVLNELKKQEEHLQDVKTKVRLCKAVNQGNQKAFPACLQQSDRDSALSQESYILT